MVCSMSRARERRVTIGDAGIERLIATTLNERAARCHALEHALAGEEAWPVAEYGEPSLARLRFAAASG